MIKKYFKYQLPILINGITTTVNHHRQKVSVLFLPKMATDKNCKLVLFSDITYKAVYRKLYNESKHRWYV